MHNAISLTSSNKGHWEHLDNRKHWLEIADSKEFISRDTVLISSVFMHKLKATEDVVKQWRINLDISKYTPHHTLSATDNHFINTRLIC